MSDLKTIKRKIINEDKIESLLEAIGCEYIKSEQRGYLYTAQLPERFYSNNKRAVQVKMNDSMNASIRNKSFSGDIFNLVSYIQFDKRDDEIQKDLHNAKAFVCELFGWTEFLKGKKGGVVVKDYTACLKEIINGKKRKKEIRPNPVLPESTLDEFQPYPSYDWIQEGISYETQKMYGIGFDLESKRITIPMRNRFGQLVGVKGRILKDEDDERKYLYLYRYQNRYEWFNFHYALPYIKMEKRVYILEAEKSPMKLFEHGIYNAVGIGASEISEEQVEMIKQIGLDIEIVLCYDKGIKKEEIRRNAELFTGRRVYAMLDVNNLLDDKDSPIDKGIDVWNKLVEDNIYEVTPKK